MKRRHSHSGTPSDSGTDWWQDSLTPASMKRKPVSRKELPAVEEDEVSESEVANRNTTMADHMGLSERYERMTA